jgi:hypothetical protein
MDDYGYDETDLENEKPGDLRFMLEPSSKEGGVNPTSPDLPYIGRTLWYYDYPKVVGHGFEPTTYRS